MKLMRLDKHGGGLWGYRFRCPGCADFNRANPDADYEHHIPTTGPNAWGFNGDAERPTFTPSILAHEVKRKDGSIHSPRCHSFVRDGRIEFLSDCGHALAGQTVDLPDVRQEA